MKNALETSGLCKYYGTRVAVQDLDWTVPAGTSWAFLGPNGSGKTTTLKLLMGFTPPSSGSSRILGEDPWELRPATKARIGFVSETPSLPPWMKVSELVRFHASFYPRWSKEHESALLDRFSLEPQIRIANLSKGQHSALMLLLALCQGSDLLLLDEPAADLDVAKRRQLLSLLAEFLSVPGHTVVFSTHIVTDVERVASHVAVLANGRLVDCASLDELQANVKAICMPSEQLELCQDALEGMGILTSEQQGRVHEVVVRRFQDGEARFDSGASSVKDLSLEDIYLALVSGIRPG